MNSAISSLIASWPWTTVNVINHLWQSTVVGLAVLAVLLLGRGLSARTRRALGWMALVKFALPTGWLTRAFSHLGSTPAPWVETAPLTKPIILPAFVTAMPAAAAPAPFSVSALCVALWLVGFVTLIVSWLVRGQRLRRQIFAAAQPIPAPLEQLIRAAAHRAGLSRPPRCFAVESELAPGVVGIFSPVLILPRGLEDTLAPAEFESVLIHEFVHVRRRDNLWGAAQAFFVSLFWFHPLVWLLNRRLGLEAEQSCDERVLEITGDPDTYAGGIVKSVRHALGVTEPGVVGATTPPVITRLKNILAHGTRPDRPWLRAAVLGGGALLLLFSGYSGSFAAQSLAAKASQPVTPVTAPPTTEPTPATKTMSPAPAAKPESTLSVDFPDESIRQILYNVANLFELKLVMPDSLQGKTTLKLHDVTWRQIFREVLEPVGYGFIEDGRNVRIVPAATSFHWSAGSAIPGNVRARNQAALDYLHAQTERLQRESTAAQQKLDAARNSDVRESDEEIGALARDAAVKAQQLAGIEKRVAEVETAAASVAETTQSTESAAKQEAEAKRQRQLADEDRGKSQNMISLEVVNERLKFSNQKMLPSGEIVSLYPTTASFAGQSGSAPGILAGAPLSLTKSGAGTLTLSGVGAFTGGTAISAGTLHVATIGNGGVPSNPVKTPADEPAITEVFRLTFVKADDVLPKISPLIDPAIGMVVVDARSNSLVVTERPTRIRYIRPIVEQLDRAAAASLLPATALPANGIKVYDISQLDQVPVAQFQTRPQYPIALRRARVTGEARIDFIVDTHGNVQNANALTSTQPEFAEAAVAAVSKWKFTSGRKEGHDVPARMQTTIVFTMNDK